MIERLRVRIPAEAAGECSFPESTLCADFIRCPFHPRVTAVARKRLGSFCQNCRWQVAPKHAYTLDPTNSEWVEYVCIRYCCFYMLLFSFSFFFFFLQSKGKFLCNSYTIKNLSPYPCLSFGDQERASSTLPLVLSGKKGERTIVHANISVPHSSSRKLFSLHSIPILSSYVLLRVPR